MELIAVSGGVDSMVLLDKYKYNSIGVIHINHNTRGQENVEEMNLVINICNDYNIPCHIFNFEHSGEGNFHKKAREFRYKKFKDIIEQYKYNAVITAHHFDDQIENILMNPKKIGKKLISELQLINGVLIKRPMLNVTKEDIYQYAQRNNIQYFEDSSNNTPKYLRNRIRMQLKDYTYDQKKELLLEENKRYDEIEKRILKFQNKKKFTCDEFNTINEVYALLKSQNIKSNISLNKINLILNFIKKNKNGQISIDKNIALIIAYNNIYLFDKSKEEKIKKVKPLKQGKNTFNGITFNNSDLEGNIRVYKTTDKVKLKNGSKKISRIFIDEKIPQHLRVKWPIIVDKNDKILKVLKRKECNI